MSKLRKTDFRALITGEVAPAATPESEAPPAPEAPALIPSSVRHVMPFRQRSSPPLQRPVGEGTLKQRAHQLSVYLEAPVYDQLRDIAFHERTKLHSLILEGIDTVLKSRGAPSIKELTKNPSNSIL